MNFKILEKQDGTNYFEVTNSKECYLSAKSLAKNTNILVGFGTLNLGIKLYGKTKKESIAIQKENCKLILSFYKRLKKIVKLLIKKNLFDGNIYVENLSQKKNNNDIMILGLLDCDFNTKTFLKMKRAYEYACDFFDAENSLNKMCNFYDNKCTKHRDKGIEKSTGCCPNFCKIRVCGEACKHKNLACKIFMCDYLIKEKGFYFTPNTVPVLKKHMTMLERAFCFGILCRTEKKSLKFLWMIRGLSILYILVMIAIICLAI